jgi:hypothetical protein
LLPALAQTAPNQPAPAQPARLAFEVATIKPAAMIPAVRGVVHELMKPEQACELYRALKEDQKTHERA